MYTFVCVVYFHDEALEKTLKFLNSVNKLETNIGVVETLSPYILVVKIISDNEKIFE